MDYRTDLAPDSVPSLFFSGFQLFSLLLTGTYFGYIYTSFKRNEHKHDHKTVEIKVFFYFFCLFM